MALRFLIPFLSFLITVVLAFALQSHHPSWHDFFVWTSLLALVIGGINVITAVLLFTIRRKSLSMVFFYTFLALLLVGIVGTVLLSEKWLAISK